MADETTIDVGENENVSKVFTQEEVNEIAGKVRATERAKYEHFAEYKKAAKELEELKNSQGTELKEATEKASKLEQELKELKETQERQNWREQVSKESGVPVDVLTGQTLDEIKSQAESLQKYFSKSKTPYISSDGFAPVLDGKMSTRDLFAKALSEKL